MANLQVNLTDESEKTLNKIKNLALTNSTKITNKADTINYGFAILDKVLTYLDEDRFEKTTGLKLK